MPSARPEPLNAPDNDTTNQAFIDTVASILRVTWLVFRVSLVVVIFGSTGSPGRRAAVRLAGSIFILYRLGFFDRLANMFGWNMGPLRGPAPRAAGNAPNIRRENEQAPDINMANPEPAQGTSRVASFLRVIALFICSLFPGLENIVAIE
jgi:hypothetical protein